VCEWTGGGRAAGQAAGCVDGYMGRGGWVLLINHFVCRGDLAGTWNGSDGSRLVGLLDKPVRGLGIFSRNLEQMGRGGWIFLINLFVCRGDLAGIWNGWIAAGGLTDKPLCVSR
jgi:hypothetical protein